MATTARATSTTGIDNRTVIMKVTTMSTRPPKYPAATPRTVPMSPEIKAAPTPINSDILAP